MPYLAASNEELGGPPQSDAAFLMKKQTSEMKKQLTSENPSSKQEEVGKVSFLPPIAVPQRKPELKKVKQEDMFLRRLT